MPRRVHDGIYKRCECARRQWPKCPHPWHFGFYFNGRDHRLSLDRLARLRNEQRPTSKTEAASWRDRLRNEIRAGLDPEQPMAAAPSSGLTVADVMDIYVKKFVGKIVKDDGTIEWSGQFLRPRSAAQRDGELRRLRSATVPAAGGGMPFGQKPIASVTKADVETIRAERRPRGIVGCNRMLAVLRHFFNWSISEGYIERTPFKRGGVNVVKLEMSAEVPRTRRLAPGEEEALLRHAAPHLRSLIVAALSTGMRIGELLSLTWHQVRFDDKGQPRILQLHAAQTKTKKNRTIPVGSRLVAELVMRRHGPDGKELSGDAYVFGNEVGDRISCVKRAWEIVVLKAHGHTPTWVKGKKGQLTRDSRDVLRKIDLRFHDLRREFSCRLLESSAELHDVRDFLGHANVSTTSRYLASSPVRLARALERLEFETPTAFAHHSHKASNAEAVDAAEDSDNRLN